MTALRARSTAKNPSESLSVETVLITPQLAKEWLATNENNRSIKKAKVSSFARQMESGEWMQSGEPIIFDSNGKLANGQHRLLAVIESGASVQMLVVSGVQPEAQSVMDTGTARTYGDVLHMQGRENAFSVAAIAKRLVAYDNGFISDGRSGKSYPAPFEIAAAIERHPGIDASAAQCKRLARGVITPATIGMWHCVLTERDPYAAEEFFASFRDGVGLPLGSPILALRNRVDRDRQTGLRVAEVEQGAMIVYAWNAFRKNATLSKLQMPRGGVNSGNFPVAV